MVSRRKPVSEHHLFRVSSHLTSVITLVLGVTFLAVPQSWWQSSTDSVKPLPSPAAADDVLTLTAHLSSVDSINPGLVPSSAGESRIAGYCAEWLSSRGAEVRVLEGASGRSSVIAVVRGSASGSAPSLLLNGHLDTVGVAGYDPGADPLEPVSAEGRLYGRGTYDMKSGVAAGMVTLARAAAASPRLPGDLVLALVADEELASAGTEESLADADVAGAAGAIILEPSDLRIVAGHRGFAWFDVDIVGRAAHGSLRSQGVDAIVKAGAFLQRLGALDAELEAEGAAVAAHSPELALLGSASIHASLISGGEGMSTYPGACRVSVEARTLLDTAPGKGGRIQEELESILASLSASDPQFNATLVRTLHRPPFTVPRDTAILGALTRAAAARRGGEARAHAPIGTTFWTDAALLSAAGIPTVMFGATGAGAHAAVEWVDEQSVRDLADILWDAAQDFSMGGVK